MPRRSPDGLRRPAYSTSNRARTSSRTGRTSTPPTRTCRDDRDRFCVTRLGRRHRLVIHLRQSLAQAPVLGDSAPTTSAAIAPASTAMTGWRSLFACFTGITIPTPRRQVRLQPAVGLWIAAAPQPTQRVGRSLPVTPPFATQVSSDTGPFGSLPVLIGDAARAFRRDTPVPFAEMSTHAVVARNARQEVAAAFRQARVHHLPAVGLSTLARLRSAGRGTDRCPTIGHRRRLAYGDLPLGRGTLVPVGMDPRGNGRWHRTPHCALPRLFFGSRHAHLDGRRFRGIHRR
jgi:hypothetical protein